MPSIFDLPNYQPYQPPWSARTARYAKYRAYYTGKPTIAWAALRWRRSCTAAHERCSRRCVRVDVAKAPASWALPDSARDYTRGQIADLRQAVGVELAYHRFLLYGSVVGEAALLLSGSPDAPELNMYRTDEVIIGVKEALVVKTAQDQRAGVGRVVEYAQVITPDSIQEYRDDAPPSEASASPVGGRQHTLSIRGSGRTGPCPG